MDVVIPLSVDLRSPDAAEQVRAVVTARGAPWHGVAPGAITVTVVSGGITNALFKASLPAKADREPLLVRCFGTGTDLFIDRDRDNATCRLLSQTGVGVPFLGLFLNGRLEGYVAARALAPAEMGQRSPVDLVSAIAVETARLHGLSAPDMPGDRRQPVLWGFLDKCFAAAAAVRFDSTSSDPTEVAKAAAFDALDMPRIGRALAWLRRVTPSASNGLGAELLVARAAELSPVAAACSAGDSAPGGGDASARAGTASAVASMVGDLRVPSCTHPLAQARVDAAAVAFSVVFAHNDLLSGNVLLSDESQHSEQCSSPVVPRGRVQLIDYEYAGFNFLAYDVANHFTEHAGFEYVLEQYPTRDVQLAWFRAYLRQRGAGVPTTATYGGSGGGPFSAGPHDEDAVSAAFLDELYTWVKRFAPLSDAWWGVWAVLQARHSSVTDFDFIGFATRRLTALHTHVGKFWGGAQGDGASFY